MLLFVGVFLGLFLGALAILVLGRFDVSRLKEGLKGLKRGPVVVREVPEELSPEPFRLFLLLQRESRFMDLLLEDMSEYSDELVGGAVKPVLAKAKKALESYVDFGRVMGQEEGTVVRVDPGYDAGRIRVVGNVAGKPPFTGVLRHPGLVVKAHRIPRASADGLVIEMAEIEV